MTLIDRLARQPIGRLAALIVASSLLALVALVLSIQTATTQAGVARAEAQRAVAEAQKTSGQLITAVCQIADGQRLHPEDPTEPKPSTARGLRTARAWQTLWETQGCAAIPDGSAPPAPLPAPTPTP